MDTFILTVILIGIMEHVTPAADLRPLQIGDLFQFRRVADPDISPDGKHVTYAVTTVSLQDNATQSHLWLADSDGSSSPRQLTRARKGFASSVEPRREVDPVPVESLRKFAAVGHASCRR